ncbi:MAG: DinB family protein [Dolichospermum sp.]
MSVSPRVELAIKHLESARAYMKGLVADLTPDEWFWTPQPPISHIAWQVGHLAVAEYGLMLFRQRGRQEVDGELMSGAFRKLFMKGTAASADRSGHPSPDEILAVLDRVHQQVLLEVPCFPDADLDQPIDPPHSVVSTRYGSMLFAGDHEMLHAGQIGFLRRLMGKSPVR